MSPHARIIPLITLLGSLTGCGSAASEQSGATTEDAAATSASIAPGAEATPSTSTEDPCVLLSRAEVEAVIGTLRADPWGSGGSCHYEAADGQRLDVDAQFSGARALASVMGVVEEAASRGLIVPGPRGLDTLDGQWDDAKWQLGNSLAARKGDAGVTVHMANIARPDPSAAAHLADLALGRFQSPLSYDGSAHDEPPALVAPGNPCALLTRDEVTRIAGAVTGDPVAEDGTYCRWPLAPRNGRARDFSYSVTWKDGFAEFNTKVGGLALYQANLEEPEMARATEGRGEQAVLGDLMKDTVASKLLGALRGAVKARGGEMADGSLLPRSDPDVKGEWTRGALLAGEELLIVQQGVCVRARIQGVGYEAAKELMSAVARRLQGL